MPLSWNEIKSRTISFVNEWKEETSEKAEAQTFQNEFLNIFGISRRRVASFEKKVTKQNKGTGFIDLFWKGMLLIEMKSTGKDLDKAVDLCYRPQAFSNERNRIEFLFELYEQYTM